MQYLIFTTMILGVSALQVATQPATRPAIPPESPKAAVQNFVESARAGNVAEVGQMLYVERDDDSLWFMSDPIAEFAIASARYQLVMRERYGSDAVGMYGVSQMHDTSQLISAEETITGDRAELVFGSSPDGSTPAERIVLARIDGVWLVPASAVAPLLTTIPSDVAARRYVFMAEALDQTVAEIQKGRFETAADAAKAAATRVDEAGRGVHAN